MLLFIERLFLWILKKISKTIKDANFKKNKSDNKILLNPKQFLALGVVSLLLLLCILVFPIIFYNFSYLDIDGPGNSTIIKFFNIYQPLLIIEPGIFFGYFLFLRRLNTKLHKGMLRSICIIISIIFICLFIIEFILFIFFTITSYNRYVRIMHFNRYPYYLE